MDRSKLKDQKVNWKVKNAMPKREIKKINAEVILNVKMKNEKENKSRGVEPNT